MAPRYDARPPAEEPAGPAARGRETGAVTLPRPAPLPDVWFTRDLPVLRAIARLVDELASTAARPTCWARSCPASGLPKAEVIAAAQALASAGYIEPLTNHAGDIVRITAISAEARRLAGLWPTPQGEWDRLLEQLAARAENAPTEVERERWRAFADAAAAVGGARRRAADVGAHRWLRAARALSRPQRPRQRPRPENRTGALRLIR